VLSRVVAAVAFIALASTPVVARTRLFCRYTGVEITDCQQQVPARAEIEVEGCCDRRTTQAPGAALTTQQQQSSPPALLALPVPLLLTPAARPLPIRVLDVGPPVFLITRALLL
jgi:hypothetical protein